MKVGRTIVTMDAVTQNANGEIACLHTPLVFMFNAFIIYDNITGMYMAQVFDDFNMADKFKNELKELKKNEKHDYIIRRL